MVDIFFSRVVMVSCKTVLVKRLYDYVRHIFGVAGDFVLGSPMFDNMEKTAAL
jgi:hypothetical protein